MPNVTYRGVTVIIHSNITIFNKMLNRICQVLSILSFLMVSSVIGTGWLGYKYVTSEQFKTKMMNQVMGNVQGLMPKVLDQGLPEMTGPSLPTTKLPKF